MTANTIFDRFDEKHMPEPNSGCWIWLAAIDVRGYGRIAFRQKNMRAPRVSWLINNGEVPARMHILHKCDNRLCVNPNHLFLGTNKENSIDKARKGRVPHAKLTADDIPAIIDLRKKGRTYKSIAQNYGVNRKTIEAIFNGRSWQHAI